MTEPYDDDDDANRPRMLSNRQVLGFIVRHRLRELDKFALIVVLMLIATACDLSIPWATRALINAVAAPQKVSDAAWVAWASLSSLYLVFYLMRSAMFRAANGFYFADHGPHRQRRLQAGASPSPPTGTPRTSPAPPCVGSAGPCGL